MHKGFVSIVDDQDTVIANKAREDVTPDDIIRVSVLWIENSKGDVLVQQRAITKKHGPGLWSPAVAGTVEAHESYESNIINEAEEEIGLAGITPVEVAKCLLWEHKDKFGRMFMFFRLKVDKPIGSFTIKSDEVAQLRWVPKTWLLNDAKKRPEIYVPSAIFWPELFDD